MSDLKPCPFCGGENLSIGYIGQPAFAYAVQCQDCNANGGDTGGISTPSGIPLPNSWKEAISKWNTRPLEDAKIAELIQGKSELVDLANRLHSKLISEGRRYGASISRKEDAEIIGKHME